MADAAEHDIFERDIIIGELENILQYATKDDQQFRIRCKDLNSHHKNFNRLQTKIEKHMLKNKVFIKEEQLKIRNNFNDCYYSIQVHLDKLKKEDAECQRRSQSNVSVSNVPTAVNCINKLPTLPLPSFSGESTDWPSYYDLFHSVIHSNGAYTDAEKFRYLLLTLHNEPLNLIKSIPITDENYSVALDILIARYENKRLIASKHLDRILDIEVCSDKSSSLRNLLNKYQENIKALEMMRFPVEEWSFLLLNILLRKIPSTTRKRFELSLRNPNNIPEVLELISFLERELSAIEISNNPSSHFAPSLLSRGGANRSLPPAAAAGPRRSFVASSTPEIASDSLPNEHGNKTRICVCCDASHTLTKCTKFLNLTPQDRYSLVQNSNVCFNCLNVGHDVKQCRSNFVCRSCHKRHHSLIHFETQSFPVMSEITDVGQTSFPPTEEANNISSLPADTQHAMTSVSVDPINIELCAASNGENNNLRTNTVLLSTAIIDICLGDQKKGTVRCLVDSGSQASFMTEDCAQRLGLARRHVNVPVYGIGGNKPVRPRGIVSCCITPKDKIAPSIPIEALILPKLISQMPTVPLPRAGWPHIQNLTLADPDFCTPRPVEMLLGADILSHILLGNIISGSPGSPIAMDSIFGYLLLGKLTFESPVQTSQLDPLQVCFSSFQSDMDLQKFWELESLVETKTLTSDEQLCESIFENTHSRDVTGRYVVALPFKPDAPLLGNSKEIAISRLHNLEYRLAKNDQLKADYNACLQEYVDLKHMDKIITFLITA